MPARRYLEGLTPHEGSGIYMDLTLNTGHLVTMSPWNGVHSSAPGSFAYRIGLIALAVGAGQLAEPESPRVPQGRY